MIYLPDTGPAVNWTPRNAIPLHRALFIAANNRLLFCFSKSQRDVIPRGSIHRCRLVAQPISLLHLRFVSSPPRCRCTANAVNGNPGRLMEFLISRNGDLSRFRFHGMAGRSKSLRVFATNAKEREREKFASGFRRFHENFCYASFPGGIDGKFRHFEQDAEYKLQLNLNQGLKFPLTNGSLYGRLHNHQNRGE